MKQPEAFLTVRTRLSDLGTEGVGLCVGYELGSWRAESFAEHLMEWLPEFALTFSELEAVHPGNMVALLRAAARKVYASEKFEKRGEFGELILHAAIRQVYGSLPAISKIFYKTSRNDTVKGFDAVHVVVKDEGLELWLGEAKFYDDVHRAIREVVEELRVHTERDYLRDEFLLIAGKIDQNWSHAQDLKRLISPNTSLDQIFTRVCIPVLLTYDSTCVASFRECSEAYCAEFEREVAAHYKTFCGKKLPGNVMIHLFLLPLSQKAELVAALDRRLRGLQNI